MLRIASQRISAFGQSCNSLVRGLPCLLLAIRRYLASGIVLSVSRHANCTLFWVVQCTGSSYRPPSCPDPLFLPGVRCSPRAERSFLCVPPCSSTYGHLPAALIARVSTFGLPSIGFPVMHWGRSHLSSRCAYHKISIESCSSAFGSHNLESRLGKSLRLPCLPRDAPFHAGFHAATILHGLRSILCDGQASSYVSVTRCIGSDRLFRVGAYIIHNPFCGHKMFVHVECTLSCEPLRAGFYGGLPMNCEPSPASGGAPPLFPAAKYGKSDCSSLCTASNFNRGVGSWLGKRLCCCDASVLYAAYHAPSHVPQLQNEPYSMLPQWASYFELMPPSLNMSMLADAGICCAVPLPTCQGRMPIGGVEGTLAKPLRSLLYVLQGTQSCFGFSLHHAEDLISMWFESFCRSALVFYFLAVLHLVFYVLPLRQGCPVGNSVVRTVRKTTRGAPLLLAMGFALYLLPGAAAMHGNNHQPAEEAEQREMPAFMRPNFVSYPHSTEDLINACDNWGVDVLGFRIATVLLRFQRTHTISCHWWDPGMNSSLLCAIVKDDCSDDDDFYAVVAANPQPGLDTVVLGEVPQWLLSSMSVPVFITVLGTQEPCFMEFFTGRVTHQDVRIATGDLWPPGAEIFVGFSSVPLAEDDLITPTPGLLFRVCRPGRGHRPVWSLDLKLQDPMRLRRLLPDEVPAPISGNAGLAVLTTGEAPVFLALPPHPTTSVVREMISQALGFQVGSFRVLAPCQPIRDITITGRLVASVMGVVSNALLACRMVFVDARDLGRSIALLALPALPYTITGVLGLLQIPRPANLTFQIRGANGIRGNPEGFMPRDAAVVTLKVVSPQAEPPSVPMPDALPGPPNSSEVHDAGASGTRHTPPNIQRSDPTLHLPDGLVSTWNRGTVDAALPSCLPGDTSAGGQAGGEPSSSNGIWRSAITPPELSEIGRDIVERASSELPGDRVAPSVVMGMLPGDANVRGDGDDGDDPDDRPDPSSSPGAPLSDVGEWRLPVRVLHYQRIQFFDTLWVALQEDIAEVMVRAEILLKPAGNFFRIDAPHVQPSGDCLTLLCFPAWWPEHGITPFVLGEHDRPGEPFLQLIRASDSLDDVLPLQGQRHDEAVDTYVTGGDEPDDDANRPGCLELLFVQRQGLPPPSFITVPELLADPSLDMPDAQIPSDEEAPATRYLLLGTGFEQAVLDTEPGPMLPQLAQKTGIPRANLIFWVQHGLFEEAAVQGVAVHRAIGYRDSRLFTSSCICTVFIDARTLGRPFCCRSLPSNRVCIQTLLALIEVDLPTDIVPEWVGGHPVAGHPELRQFAHCSTIILWARYRVPPPANLGMAATGSGADGEDRGPPDDDDRPRLDNEDGLGEVRSRSPMRGYGEATHRLSTPPTVDHPDVSKGAVVTDGSCVSAFGTAARPIATPCRSLHHCKLQDGTPGFLGSLPTLLETAQRPYWEHFVEQCVRVAEAALSHFVIAPAHTSVGWRSDSGRPSEELSFGELKLGFTRDHISCLLCHPASLTGFEDALNVCDHDSRVWFAQNDFILSNPAPSHIHCFTDGSYKELSGGSCQLGWACAFFRDELGSRSYSVSCLGAASGATPRWAQDSTQPSAYKAECIALAHAAWIAARNFPGQHVTFLSDCVAALGAASSTVSYDPSGVPGTTHGLHLLRRASSPGEIRYTYVPGHADVYGNEFVDSLAKAAAAGTCLGSVDLEDAALWLSQGGPKLPWFALACRSLQRSPQWPAVDGQALGPLLPPSTPPDLLLKPFLPIEDGRSPLHHVPVANNGLETPASPHAPSAITLKIATYNALSLAAPLTSHQQGPCSEGLAFRIARPALLAQCLSDACVDVAAIQETRCAQGVLRAGAYHRICSGSENGQYGTEWWFRVGHALLRAGRKKVILQPDRFVVHHASPRRLLLSIEQGGPKLFFLALHAPHRGAEAHTIDRWWHETIEICRQIINDDECVIAGDMNASIGSICSDNVGDHDQEVEDLAGSLLHRLLQERKAWVPCTYPHLHSGQSWTYVQKRNGHPVRPDLIALPLNWWWGDVKSQVEAGIHAGQTAPDHYAATVQVCVRLRERRHFDCWSTARGRRFDAEAMSRPENRQTVARVIQGLPEVPWHTSAHDHAAQIVDQLQAGLQQHFPVRGQKVGRRHSFLTDATWAIHVQVAQLRRACGQCRYHVSRHLLAAAFRAWKTVPDGPGFSCLYFSGWFCHTTRTHALLCHELALQGKRLRNACAKDRSAFLDECARKVDRGLDREAYNAVRRLLGHKRRRPFTPDVLPSLLLKNGQPCATAAEVAARWKEHFSELEAGQDATPTILLDSCSAARQHAWPTPPSIQDLPSEADLARVIATASRHKAPGFDGVPAEAGLCHPGLLAEKLYPLLLKFCLCGEEPVGLKGGALAHIYKGRGGHNVCGSHRGILLLSTLSKYLHKAMRPAIGKHFLHTSPPLQLGGKPGVPVGFTAHLVRGFLRWQNAEGSSAGVIFSDISAAYYAAVRQLVAPVELSSFSQVSAGLSLPDGDVQELRRTLGQPCALAADDASPWLQAVTAQIHSGTWMGIIGSQPNPVLTHRGTRPGSCWADIAFGVILKRILQCRDQHRFIDRVPRVPWDNTHNPFETGVPRTWVPLTDAVWADDISICLSFSGPHDVEAGFRAETGVLSDAFRAHGMELNYGPRKTAAIAAIRGPGTKQVKANLFARPTLAVLRENDFPASLPLVHQYRQVGVVHCPDGSIRAELKQRIGDAWSSYRQGRRKLFRSPQLSVATKMTLWRSLVLSRLFFAAGAWPTLNAGESRLLQATVVNMMRQIAGPKRGQDQRLFLCEICANAQSAGPDALLRAERLRYLRQLISTGPDALWSLIKADRTSCEPLCDALVWMQGRVECPQGLGPPYACWDEWEEFLKTCPKGFKALVHRALALDSIRQRCLAALCKLHRRLTDLHGQDLRGPPVPEWSDLTEACAICRVAFGSRLAWASHAARVHGYRCIGTQLAEGRTCKACGKLFASTGRLRRHLQASPFCRETWGSFEPVGEEPEPHLQCPPSMRQGIRHASFPAPLEPACVGLASRLRAASWGADVQDTDVFRTVTECIAPLPDLRRVVVDWMSTLDPSSSLYDAAESVSLILVPACAADRVQIPKSRVEPLLPSVPKWKSVGLLPRVMSGMVAWFKVASPPFQGFHYPFDGPFSVGAAGRVAQWLEEATSAVAAACEACLEQPVCVRIGRDALAAMPPAKQWLLEAGFMQDGDVFHSSRLFH